MKLFIDPEYCLGCGICQSIAPEVFQLGDLPHCVILLNPIPEAYRLAVLDAIEKCPEGAIEIEEESRVRA